FYVTGHPLVRYEREVKKHATCSLQDLAAQKDRSQISVAGVVEKFKMKRTKKGDKMATIRLEDLTGSTEVIIFPELFSKAAHLLKGDEPLLVSGIAEINENTAKIIASEILTLESIRQKGVRAIQLELEERRISRDLLEDLLDIVFKHPGDCELLFRVKAASGREYIISANERFRVLPSKEFLAEAESLLGDHVIPMYQ
ncbi:MAG: DNA polymerase III subunit alpha, partial [Deltaproteobacteria bacterium]